jgi:hypothetical protein
VEPLKLIIRARVQHCVFASALILLRRVAPDIGSEP